MEKKNLKTEQGRSMVEMLGVLAVIGVLTIIGIAGFRIALNKHYANQTVERLMRRAVVVAGQANFGQTLSLHEFDENDGEYPITLLDRTDNESFTMQADNVPNEVCQLIVGLDWKMAKIIPEDCSDNTMQFKFLNDLTDCSDCQVESVDCPPENEMQCGTCSVVRGFIDNNTDCEGNENGNQCVRGKCLKCDDGYFRYREDCVLCQNVKQSWGTADTAYRTGTTKHNCLGDMFYSTLYDTMRGCISTDSPVKSADELSCKECKNSEGVKNRCFETADNTCHLVGGTTGLVRNTDGTCGDCQTGYFGWKGNCSPCQNVNQKWGTADAAIPLSSSKHNCLGDMFYSTFYDTMRGCISTDSPVKSADELSCKECKNSEGVKNHCYLNGTCYLAGEGQEHQRVSETDGTCQQ